MMSSYFFKILAILLSIAVIVEKVQANKTTTKTTTKTTETTTKKTTPKPTAKTQVESKNTTEGFQCYSSEGWENHTNHTNQMIDCKNGHCFGAWLTGE